MGKQYRNVGIVAHIDAGKTTLTERILYTTGSIRHAGEVQDGTTVTDWLRQERERGISISAAAVSCGWRDLQINIVDTPGHVDFTAEVERSLGVMDAVIAVVCAVSGVQSQTESVWRRAVRHKLPGLVFVNKMDRDGAEPKRVLEQLVKRFGEQAIPLQYPVMENGEFIGVVDIVSRKLTRFGGNPPWEDIPRMLDPDAEQDGMEEDLIIGAESARLELVEFLAGLDDEVLDCYVNAVDPDEELLRRAVRKAVVSQKMFPVLFGSSLRNQGVAELLDAVVDYLPAPQERMIRPEYASADGGERPVAMVYRLCPSQYGRLACVRVFSSSIMSGQELVNARTGGRKTVKSVFGIQAADVDGIETGEEGSIVALQGDWSQTRTGDFLVGDGVRLKGQKLHFPQPVVSMNVEAVDATGEARLENALKVIVRDDPTLHARRIPGTVGWTLSGMGELHLEIALDMLKNDFGIATRVGEPRVEYLSTVRGSAQGTGLFEKRFPNGVEISAGVDVLVEPLDAGKGLKENFDCLDGTLPAELALSVRQGVLNIVRAENSGFPMTDMKVTVLRVHSLKGDMPGPALVSAARAAVEDAVSHAGSCVLEPVMKLEVDAPVENMGAILADLNSRHAVVQQVETYSAGQGRIVALAPLAELFGYASSLRSLSAGRGEVVAEPDAYQVRATH